MKKIIIIGAGRVTIYLIEYLARYAKQYQWRITIADRDFELAKSRVIDSSTNALSLDIQDTEALSEAISNHDLIVSMLPAHLHMDIAKQCLDQKKNLCTASYLNDAMKALNSEVKSAGLIFLNELGLDPGIDHLSAMALIDNIKANGGRVDEFESFTGGLVAPESDDNPWNYKFSWNPRNVVLAGQGGAVKFIQNGRYKFIPYHKLFRRTEIIEIEGFGKFEGYANRDSLMYRETYGLESVKTMYRGTLRRPGFCRAWDKLIQLGATDDSYILPNSAAMTNRDFVNTFLEYNIEDSVEIKLRQYLKIDQDDVDIWDRLVWLDLFKEDPINISNASPAMILEHILSKKWGLSPTDKDMIVMWHKLRYTNGEDKVKEMHSSMVAIGDTGDHTAMARTVGLPLAMGCKHILLGNIKEKGTILPITKDIYEPILKELALEGIVFNEKIIS
jgi:saccharopine dehydrogenase-like NADP-dependent oxidoreductase